MGLEAMAVFRKLPFVTRSDCHGAPGLSTMAGVCFLGAGLRALPAALQEALQRWLHRQRALLWSGGVLRKGKSPTTYFQGFFKLFQSYAPFSPSSA